MRSGAVRAEGGTPSTRAVGDGTGSSCDRRGLLLGAAWAVGLGLPQRALAFLEDEVAEQAVVGEEAVLEEAPLPPPKQQQQQQQQQTKQQVETLATETSNTSAANNKNKEPPLTVDPLPETERELEFAELAGGAFLASIAGVSYAVTQRSLAAKLEEEVVVKETLLEERGTQLERSFGEVEKLVDALEMEGMRAAEVSEFAATLEVAIATSAEERAAASNALLLAQTRNQELLLAVEEQTANAKVASERLAAMEEQLAQQLQETIREQSYTGQQALELQEVNEQLMRSESERVDLERRLAALAQTEARAAQDLEDAKVARASDIDSLQDALEQEREGRLAVQELADQLRQEVAEARLTINEMRTEREEREAEFVSLSEELAQEKEQVAVLEESVKEAEVQLAQEASRMQEQIFATEERNLQKINDMRENLLSELRNVTFQSQSHTEALQKQLEANNNAAQEEKQGLLYRLDSISKEVMVLRRDRTELLEMLEESTNFLKESNLRLADSEQDNSNLRESLHREQQLQEEMASAHAQLVTKVEEKEKDALREREEAARAAQEAQERADADAAAAAQAKEEAEMAQVAHDQAKADAMAANEQHEQEQALAQAELAEAQAEHAEAVAAGLDDLPPFASAIGLDDDEHLVPIGGDDHAAAAVGEQISAPPPNPLMVSDTNTGNQ